MGVAVLALSHEAVFEDPSCDQQAPDARLSFSRSEVSATYSAQNRGEVKNEINILRHVHLSIGCTRPVDQ